MGLVNVEEFTSQPRDHIIVGGETAGLTVAARLSEDANPRVCMIEAGSARLGDPKIGILGASLAVFGSREYDWALATTPHKHAIDAVIKYPRGCVLGGSSAINFMNWTQTSRIDLDAWEKLGNPGWNWDALLPYFVKAETFHTPTDAAREFYPVESNVFDPSRRGTDGPIQTGLPGTNDFVSKLWPETCRNAGINAGNPPNEPRDGYSLVGLNHLQNIDRGLVHLEVAGCVDGGAQTQCVCGRGAGLWVSLRGQRYWECGQ